MQVTTHRLKSLKIKIIV